MKTHNGCRWALVVVAVQGLNVAVLFADHSMERSLQPVWDLDSVYGELHQDPVPVFAAVDRCVASMKEEHYDDAAAELTALIEKNPDFAWGFVLRGLCYGFTGDDDNSLKDLNRAIYVCTARRLTERLACLSRWPHHLSSNGTRRLVWKHSVDSTLFLISEHKCGQRSFGDRCARTQTVQEG